MPSPDELSWQEKPYDKKKLVIERVPPSLAPIVPILHAANDIEKQSFPFKDFDYDPVRVANLCRWYAFEKTRNIESSERGAFQFKISLWQCVQGLKEDEISNLEELHSYYKTFYEQIVEKNVKREEIEEILTVAQVLYETLLYMDPNIDDETIQSYVEKVENKRKRYKPYNILPLCDDPDPEIMKLPEIKAAREALHARHLARLEGKEIFDWLLTVFKFQKGNVENQREHLILLLANIDIRNKSDDDPEYFEQQLGQDENTVDTPPVPLHEKTVKDLRDEIFKNYVSWCYYLDLKVELKNGNMELIYIGLYLLIWGEASNIRFMPECICYIFHQMCGEVNAALSGEVSQVTGANYSISPPKIDFLSDVITPFYEVLASEAKRKIEEEGRHSLWKNYDDLNEYFWSRRCLKLGMWPIELKKDESFWHKVGDKQKQGLSEKVRGICGRMVKTNFVEFYTHLHMYRSFHRMWIFFILALQAMIIVAWSSSGPLPVSYDEDLLRRVMSIFTTYAFFSFLQATLDILLTRKAWKNMNFNQILRYLLRFMVALVWLVILPFSYYGFLQDPSGLPRFFPTAWSENWTNHSIYSYLVAIYILPNVVAATLFFLPSFQRELETSNRKICRLLMWWPQQKLYIGRGMHENLLSLLCYTLFWIMLLICKLTFSYYVEILPLIGPTKSILGMPIEEYKSPEIFPGHGHNFGIIIAIWAPIILVYFMDTQIWYAIFSTLVGGILGLISHLGEMRSIGMLCSRFESLPSVFRKRCMPNERTTDECCPKLCNKFIKSRRKEDLISSSDEDSIVDDKCFGDNKCIGRSRATGEEELKKELRDLECFSKFWNEFIESMRKEDLISSSEEDLLVLPNPNGGESKPSFSSRKVPPSVLAGGISTALEMAKDYEGEGEELTKKIEKKDEYMYSAIVECYEMLKEILEELLTNEQDKDLVHRICDRVESSIKESNFVEDFKMSSLPSLRDQLVKLLKELKDYNGEVKSVLVALRGLVDTITQDVIVDRGGFIPDKFLDDCICIKRCEDRVYINNDDKSWKKKVVRLYSLLTAKESDIRVPSNLEARRRITFFANSLLMDFPRAPKVHQMLSFSVLTPYYKEDVLYSDEQLHKKNEDGISVLFYLQKIYPDEWSNFMDRRPKPRRIHGQETRYDGEREWTSCRAQTLYRTVRGIMYYRKALELQCKLDYNLSGEDENLDRALALADLKFTYVVSCQVYGAQKKSENCEERNRSEDILKLMLEYRALRVAYIDEVEEKNGTKVYYSVLVKGGYKHDQEIYRIKLPGSPIKIGEGKPENQNHAIIFTRGEALQAIDMNQDNYFEEAFKMRNVLQEFDKKPTGRQEPTILGLREHIFTGSVSSLAWFMSNQETSFVTIGQRILACPLRVRFHYGHPDIFDRIFHITRGGISKASKVINLSEDTFAGFNSTLRGGLVTHHEYIQLGKGRDVGMNQISTFEAKVANGNGQQTLCRDVYRLGQRFDFFRMLSFYFTTVGFYFSSMVSVLTVYVFLYGRLYLVLTGVEREVLRSRDIEQNKSLREVLAAESVVQLGFLLVLPMVMETCLEKGIRAAMRDFIIMQLEMASVFFTFQLGTKAHYFGRTILHGGAKYRATGREFVVYREKFAANYRMYSRSHFVKALEIVLLLIVYEVYGLSYHGSILYFFITFSMWYLAVSWLIAPFLFNPSSFDWQKTADDWIDWKKWISNPGGIGSLSEDSWESWWRDEYEQPKYSNIRGQVLDILFAFRFFVYQYGIVYRLDIAHHSKSWMVYGLSWAFLAPLLVGFEIAAHKGRRRFRNDIQRMFRVLTALVFLSIISIATILFVVCGLTVPDLFASILAFLPSGWALILIGQSCRGFSKKKISQPDLEKWIGRLGVEVWYLIKELTRVYDYMMGVILFLPIAILSWFPLISEFQTRLLFNQGFSRGLQISKLLAGTKFTEKQD